MSSGKRKTISNNYIARISEGGTGREDGALQLNEMVAPSLISTECLIYKSSTNHNVHFTTQGLNTGNYIFENSITGGTTAAAVNPGAQISRRGAYFYSGGNGFGNSVRIEFGLDTARAFIGLSPTGTNFVPTDVEGDLVVNVLTSKKIIHSVNATEVASTDGNGINIRTTSNQMAFGASRGNKTTFSVITPSSAKTISFQDPGTNCNVIYSESDQTINGVKTFANSTDSSSSTTGGTKFSGGVGIAKKCNIGTSLSINGGSDLTVITKNTTSSIVSASLVSAVANVFTFSMINNSVTMNFPLVSDRIGASNQTVIWLAAVPSAFRPATDQLFNHRILVGGVIVSVWITITAASGNITVGSAASGTPPGANFTGTNAFIFYATNFSWLQGI